MCNITENEDPESSINDSSIIYGRPPVIETSGRKNKSTAQYNSNREIKVKNK